MPDIAIFPIPGCVSFPHTTMPLHVFEPRYRQMIKDCINENRLLGVCDVQKEIKPAKKNQALNEALHSNQATYKPEAIFSAGKCELIETLSDGRMHLNVNLESRYRIKQEIQTLPYIIADSEEVLDAPITKTARAEANQYQEKIISRLRAIATDIPELKSILSNERWTLSDPIEFSFKIFGTVRLEPTLSQKILEMRSATERLAYFLNQLNATAP